VDEPEPVEWLPPQAPGAAPPPHFAPTAVDPAWPAPTAPAPAAPPVPAQARPGSTNASARWSLIAGIGGLILFVFPSGFGLVFIFNLPCSVMAWVLGREGRRRADAGEGPEYRGRVHAGMVLGILGVVLGVAAIIAWAIAIATSEELRNELSRAFERGRK
jgi:hypothetical protein